MVTPGTTGTPQNKSTQVQKQVQNPPGGAEKLHQRNADHERGGRPGGARTRAPRRPGRKATGRGERGQAPGQAPAPAVSDGLEDAPKPIESIPFVFRTETPHGRGGPTTRLELGGQTSRAIAGASRLPRTCTA